MSGGEIWLVIGLVAALMAVIEGAGASVLAGRELPRALVGVIVLMPSALLAARVVSTALADGDTLRVGASTAGVATVGVLLLVRASPVVAVLVAVVVTVGLRAAGLA